MKVNRCMKCGEKLVRAVELDINETVICQKCNDELKENMTDVRFFLEPFKIKGSDVRNSTFGVRFRLFNHPRLWELLDYPGSSVEYGGYVDRGFDDIDWLPDQG